MQKYLDFKEAKCKNCYKCLKSCPVKAIKIEENQAKIMEKKCILCGKCTLICPQNAKSVHSKIKDIEELIKSNRTIASVAPSFISVFNVKNFPTFYKALKKLGFEFAEETARGAKVVVDEYEKIINEKKYKNFITSCCPAVNRMISLYYPKALKFLAPVDSPVIAHSKILKHENPDSKIVFIGPCIAKKRECDESEIVDGVLTFEELEEMFEKYNINLEEIESQEENTYNKARFFPISRGIIKSFNELSKDYEYIAVDGVERCKEALKDIDSLENVFLELNACQGSCINGPCRLNKDSSAISANTKVRKYVSESLKSDKNYNEKTKISISCEHKKINYSEKIPTEDEIIEVLAKTGKFKKEDELNCGACGYSSCREKAWAVINGYADIEMCLPYMRERAENMSYEIIQNSPNGIMVIDKDLKIVDINSTAKRLIGLTNFKSKKSNILEYINESTAFVNAINEEKNICEKQIKITKTDSYIELSITYMKEHNVMFAIMKDITEEVNYNEKLDKVKLDTISITDDVIKKQMRVAQEIASLLGETTAETKVALVNLKKSLKYEDKKGKE